jgi:DNA-binding Lrp family transcriptional regulator
MKKKKFSLARARASKKLESDAAVSILSSFRVRGNDRDPKQEKFEELTWNQMRERSRLSEGALSKYVEVLFEKGYLKGEVRYRNHRRAVLYSLAHPEFGTVYGFEESDRSEEEVRFIRAKDPEGRKVILGAISGVNRRTGRTKDNFEKTVFRQTRAFKFRLKKPEQ